MNAAGRALVLLFVMAGAATVAFGAWGTTPGANGDLVFRRYFDDSHTWGAIFTTTTSGRNVRQLTQPPKGVLDNVPDWSPDGRHIVINRGYLPHPYQELAIFNVSTHRQRRITNDFVDEMQASWGR